MGRASKAAARPRIVPLTIKTSVVARLFREELIREIAGNAIAGWYRAHKHTGAPTEDQIREQVEAYVSNVIHEYLDFEGEE